LAKDVADAMVLATVTVQDVADVMLDQKKLSVAKIIHYIRCRAYPDNLAFD
jgi:hypothetical protein